MKLIIIQFIFKIIFLQFSAMLLIDEPSQNIRQSSPLSFCSFVFSKIVVHIILALPLTVDKMTAYVIKINFNIFK
ncbi:hypothetical protein A9G25_09770 [Gilliamella sp. Bif1-4]|nr:hypothetical protein A9G25_09770 [Gilliamella apicola]